MKRRSFCTCLLLATCALILGCAPKEALLRFTPPEDDELARKFLSHVRSGRYEDAGSLLSRGIAPLEVTKGLRELNGLLTESEERAVEVVGVNVMTNASLNERTKTTNLSYQVEQSRGWLVGSVVIVRGASGAAIASARFNRIPASLQELNRFTFENKKGIHYVFFFAGIAVVLFILWTLVICVRSKIRRKWLWIIVILLGLGTARLNWSTGQSDFQVLSFQLFGTSTFAGGPYAPWIIGVSFPLGAVLFLVRRNRLVAAPNDRTLQAQD